MQLARAARTRAGQQLLAAFLGQVDRIPGNASCARRAGIGGIAGDEVEIPRREGARADLLLEEIELVAVVRAAVAAEHREPAGVVEFVGEAQPRLPRALERRSEEHTSELQSLMRISYAVFSLK